MLHALKLKALSQSGHAQTLANGEIVWLFEIVAHAKQASLNPCSPSSQSPTQCLSELKGTLGYNIHIKYT